MNLDDASAALVRERDRDRYLATLYAPAAARPALFALHALDLELAEVARTTTEPMLGQIRLAWWREQLQALDMGTPSPQPVLAAVAGHLLPAGISGASLEPLEDANLALLDGDIDAYAGARSLLFEVALRVLVNAPEASLVEWARSTGKGWAIIDAMRGGRVVDTGLLDTADRLLARRPVPAPARLLVGLATLARADLAALKADGKLAPRGTPSRQMRLLWSVVTGR
jgi:phytoene synthase